MFHSALSQCLLFCSSLQAPLYMNCLAKNHPNIMIDDKKQKPLYMQPNPNYYGNQALGTPNPWQELESLQEKFDGAPCLIYEVSISTEQNQDRSTEEHQRQDTAEGAIQAIIESAVEDAHGNPLLRSLLGKRKLILFCRTLWLPYSATSDYKARFNIMEFMRRWNYGKRDCSSR